MYRCPQTNSDAFQGGVLLCQVFPLCDRKVRHDIYHKPAGEHRLRTSYRPGTTALFYSLIVMSIRYVLASQQQPKENGMYLYCWWAPSVLFFTFAFNLDILFHHWLRQKNEMKSSKGLRLNSREEKGLLLTAGLCS